jgi:predicted ATPase
MTVDHGIVPPFLRRVVIRNYKSIAACDVRLKPRTILVGRNGAGKSNFLDALRFVGDALHTSLEQAINKRGGIDLVHRQASGPRRVFSIRLEFGLPDHKHAVYEIEISTERSESFTVVDERLDVCDSSGRPSSHFRRQGDELSAIRSLGSESPLMPPTRRDRLYLVNAAALPDFGEAFDALNSMAFYQLNPETMKEFGRPEAEEILESGGANIASCVGRLEARNPEALERINEYLKCIVPEIQGVKRVSLGPGEALVFEERNDSQESFFYAGSMSDGTLRALGILIAANQRDNDDHPLRLVGVEEPETALHPAAAGALMDALREVESDTQVILTTHSADLLDQIDPAIDGLLVVTSRGGRSLITMAHTASLEAVKQHLYTLGDLQRMDQLQGEPERQKDIPRSATEAEVS